MRICLIVEGAYPYITGGVSNWINALISNMSEHEFVIYTIGAQLSHLGKYKYTLPANVIEIKETFMDDYPNESIKYRRRFRLSYRQKEAFLALLGAGGNVNWDNIFSVLRTKTFLVDDFLRSQDFFNIVVELSKAKYAKIPFSEIFGMVRSMILPLLMSIRHEIPEADLYHSVSTGYAGVVGSLAKYISGKPYILTEHGIYYRERQEEIIRADWIKPIFKNLWLKHFYELSASAYHYSDQVITLFERNREIEIELGCHPDKIKIIPNGVDIQDYYEVATAPFMDGQPIRLGIIARVVPIKDIMMTIQSFAIVKREIPDVELYIMGPSDENEMYYKECLKLIETMNLEGIVFTGSVQVKEYLGRIDILLLSSISEGMPLAILEGMACAKPVITTDVGNCRELLYGLDDTLGPAGIIVPIINCGQMAEAIIQLCNNRELRIEMGQTGLERVSKYYTMENFIKSYQKLYETYKEM